MPTVIEIAGSSTWIGGSGDGSSGSARVSPMVMSAMPATAMRSPAVADSTGTRSSASVISSSVIFVRETVPSGLIQATCWPLRIVPSITRHMPIRPRNGEASMLVTCACSGAPGVYVGRRDRGQQRVEQRVQVGASPASRRCRAWSG